jgi:hypothetical protein
MLAAAFAAADGGDLGPLDFVAIAMQMGNFHRIGD